ncbi:uncharacterized protein LOC131942930 [Physella acuta]|uniref:uncharacterized protein LOC131942930 n=1 Tax=Physella acuta TaxID=109671 RepID=UPI0027DBD4DC|nr:uncharacterized protein LOC131942930 [Physella acuta]
MTLSSADIQSIMRRHNQIRQGANVTKMAWVHSTANLAAAWGEGCTWSAMHDRHAFISYTKKTDQVFRFAFARWGDDSSEEYRRIIEPSNIYVGCAFISCDVDKANFVCIYRTGPSFPPLT